MKQEFCAGYCRCSTDMQDRSIPDQRKEIELFAQRNNLKIIRWFIDEDRSGTSIARREGFQEMKTLVEEGRNDFSTILIYDLSRWGRFPDPRESIYWEVYFEKRGVYVTYTNDDVQNTKTFQSAIVRAVKHAVAGDYSRRLSVLITRAFASRAKEGLWNGGPPPYGYKRAEINNKKDIVRILEHRERCHNPRNKIILVLGDKEEVETVRKIFDYLVNKDMDFWQIAQKLNHEGMSAPSYKWIQTSKAFHKGFYAPNKPGKWGYHSIYKIIRNELYTGKMIWGVKKRGVFSAFENLWGDKEGKKTRHDKQNVIKCSKSHFPIVSEKLFKRAQEKVKRGEKSRRVRKKCSYSPYLLSGIIECGKCGFRFSGGYFGGKSHRNRPNYFSHHFYRDSGSTLRSERVCSAYYIKMDSLDNLILDEIKKRITANRSIAKISRMLIKAFRSITEIEMNIEQLTSEVVRTEEEIQELVRLGVECKNTPDVEGLLDDLIERYERMLDDKRKLESVKRLITTLPSVAKVIWDYYNFCIKTMNNSSQQEKKMIVRNVIDKIVIDKNGNSARIYFFKVPAQIDLYLELLSLHLKTTFTSTVRLPRGRIGLVSQRTEL